MQETWFFLVNWSGFVVNWLTPPTERDVNIVLLCSHKVMDVCLADCRCAVNRTRDLWKLHNNQCRLRHHEQGRRSSSCHGHLLYV